MYAVDDAEIWPRTHTNTILNICQKGDVMVVERLGKLHNIYSGGYFFAIPVVDNIRFVIDMRERSLSVDPQSCITKDNVHVQVSGNLYCQFVDPEKAAYGAKNPLYAVSVCHPRPCSRSAPLPLFSVHTGEATRAVLYACCHRRAGAGPDPA